jgi:hypothetical protein
MLMASLVAVQRIPLAKMCSHFANALIGLKADAKQSRAMKLLKSLCSDLVLCRQCYFVRASEAWQCVAAARAHRADLLCGLGGRAA